MSNFSFVRDNFYLLFLFFNNLYLLSAEIKMRIFCTNLLKRDIAEFGQLEYGRGHLRLRLQWQIKTNKDFLILDILVQKEKTNLITC